MSLKLPNVYESVIILGGNRRKSFTVCIPTGNTDEGKQKFANLGFYESRKRTLVALAKFNKNPFYYNQYIKALISCFSFKKVASLKSS